MTEAGNRLVLKVPLTFKRRRGRIEIIVPEGCDTKTTDKPRTNQSIALAVARAHYWRELLEEGRFSSARALAAAVGVHHSYVGRTLHLTLLAPDIIESIMLGYEPDGMSLEQLYRLPAEWREQRKVLGVHQ